MKRLAYTPIVLLALCAFSAPAFAAAPATVILEGMLTSSGGGAAADGVYNVTFRIYDKDTGGTELWAETTKIESKGGQFHHALGSVKAIDAKMLVAKGGMYIGMKVESDAEMPRAPLHSALFARYAEAAGDVVCAGCIGKDHIANGAIAAAKLGATYAASDTAGGPATKAMDLSCTGCVTVAHMKFDKDVDLGKVGLKTSGTIAATAFIGDGSQLTGIKTPTGSCTTAGEVMKGIDKDGKPVCVLALDAKNLPAGGLNEISSDTMSNHFDDTIKGGANIDIPDNSSAGLLDIINVPDIGKADTLEFYVEITKTPFVDVNPKDGKSDFDTRDVTVLLFPPTTKDLPSNRANIVNNFLKTPNVDQTEYPHYILHSLGGDAGDLTLAKTYPTKHTPVSGDIHKDWLGKNPTGKWRLMIIDNSDRPSATTDGKLVTWHMKLQTTSTTQVLTKANQFVDGELYGKYNGHQTVQTGGALGAPVKIGNGAIFAGTKEACGSATEGLLYYDKTTKYLKMCDGTRWRSLNNGGATYRWVKWSTYNQWQNWFFGNNASLMGGVNPSSWGNGSYRAVHISANTDYLRTFFTRRGPRIDANIKQSMVCADEWYSYSSTNSRHCAVLFRIKNTTAGNITWKPYWWFSAYAAWGEHASVAINGSEVWDSGGGNYGASNGATSHNITIPANRTSTVIFVSSSTPVGGATRGLQLAFYNSSLVLPNGLEYVDDLDTKTSNSWSN